ncbi:MAG: DUF1549 and DUF1553 domain-containing protein [Lentisphaeraceae bacterium]|nr:DUF1549 and DUF1553 domain-containing protein [Lentisphaeraceae bacterium]
MNKAIVWFSLFVVYSNSVFGQGVDFTQKINLIIEKKLAESKQTPRGGISDETFCRRVYLDVIGRIPTYKEVTAFLTDKSESKRQALIHQLLNSKGYISNFTNVWNDVLRITYTPDKLHSPMNYMEFVKDSLRQNKPYDKFVRDLLSAEGELYKPGNGQTGFYAREVMQLDHMSSTVKAFLGMSIECAQCHDHPFDDWTQKEFYELAAFTTKVDLRVDPVKKDMQPYDALNKKLKPNFNKWIVLRESLRMKHASVLGNGTGYIRLPENYQYDDAKPYDVMEADVLFGAKPTVHYKAGVQAIQKIKNKKNLGPLINSKNSFADWVTSRNNEMFVKNIVNRLWFQLMGSELVGPLTNIELGEFGEHPELTETLMTAMSAVNYDMKAFLKIILKSKAYQSKAYSVQQVDKKYLFDGPVVSRMSAENIWDSFLSITMADPDKSLPDGFKHDGFTYFYELSQKMGPKEFEAYILKHKFSRGSFYNYNHKEAEKVFKGEKRKDYMRASEFWHPLRGSHVMKMFGQSTRELIDGANKEPNIPQTLLMMNGDFEQRIILDGKNSLNTLIRANKSKQDRLDAIFLAILSRHPKSHELARLKDYELNDKNLKDLVWALLNSNEFKFKR